MTRLTFLLASILAIAPLLASAQNVSQAEIDLLCTKADKVAATGYTDIDDTFFDFETTLADGDVLEAIEETPKEVGILNQRSNNTLTVTFSLFDFYPRVYTVKLSFLRPVTLPDTRVRTWGVMWTDWQITQVSSYSDEQARSAIMDVVEEFTHDFLRVQNSSECQLVKARP